MVLGYICSCCGENVSRPTTSSIGSSSSIGGTKDDIRGASLGGNLCQPCGGDNGASAPIPIAAPPDMSVHTIPLSTPVVSLEASSAFSMLTRREQLYAYYLGRADWEGAKICLLQCSVESAPIFCLLQLVFSLQPIEELKGMAAAAPNGLTSEEISHVIMYAAAFYGNMGNYKSFGDTKFVPAVPQDRFHAFVQSATSTSISAVAEEVERLWQECHQRMYSLTPRQRQMGLGESKGISTYFSANCEDTDAKRANAFLDSIGLSAYNTRLFKDTTTGHYTVRIASTDTSPPQIDDNGNTHTFQEKTFILTRGDYSPILSRTTNALTNALPYTANPNQTTMLQQYLTSFTTGSIPAHKDASRAWISDTAPAVESYIGFIESYRDPSGVRGEWEGFVSCVNREVSKKFGKLVDGAEGFLKEMMPWGVEWEKDEFMRPDFTSLEVLAFGSSGVPAGINIPNYDDIRQTEGFKNVSLGNVLQASYGVAPDTRVIFVSENDQDNFKTYKATAFEVQVGIHELLGHGSGKLYHQDTTDVEQLRASNVKHPLTGECPIEGPFYKKGATWNSTFGKIAPTYEECRAECCGLFLCLERDILQVFGITGDTEEDGGILDVTYVNWLLMARAGLMGLEFYTPQTGEWRQAHMQARYVILQLLLETATKSTDDDKNSTTPLLSLHQFIDPEDGKPNVEVLLNRDLISSIGKKVVGDFLLKLHVYKSLGDVENGTNFYNQYSVVTEEMAALREIVMERKEPRKILIQPHMCLEHGTTGSKAIDDGDGDSDVIVRLQTFPVSPEGMVESFVARFPAEDPELMALYEADKASMTE